MEELQNKLNEAVELLREVGVACICEETCEDDDDEKIHKPCIYCECRLFVENLKK